MTTVKKRTMRMERCLHTPPAHHQTPPHHLQGAQIMRREQGTLEGPLKVPFDPTDTGRGVHPRKSSEIGSLDDQTPTSLKKPRVEENRQEGPLAATKI